MRGAGATDRGGVVLLAEYGSDAYKIVLALHILCAIVGFGAVFLNGLYGQQAKSRKGAEGLAIAEANELVSKVGEYFIYAVFILGIALVLIGDPVHKFGQTWVWLAMTLYVVGIGISHGLLLPRVRRLMALANELNQSGPPAAGSGPPPQVIEMETVGKQVGIYGASLNLLLVVILTLMVFKPNVVSITTAYGRRTVTAHVQGHHREAGLGGDATGEEGEIAGVASRPMEEDEHVLTGTVVLTIEPVGAVARLEVSHLSWLDLGRRLHEGFEFLRRLGELALLDNRRPRDQRQRDAEREHRQHRHPRRPLEQPTTAADTEDRERAPRKSPANAPESSPDTASNGTC